MIEYANVSEPADEGHLQEQRAYKDKLVEVQGTYGRLLPQTLHITKYRKLNGSMRSL
jgi:hypothetical protein